MGDLTEIRNNTLRKKSRTMVNNFWRHADLQKRIMEKAEEFGITIKLVNELGTSSTCPRCSSTNYTRRKRLFKCKDCGLEAHRDAVGSENIGVAQGLHIPAGLINKAVAPSHTSL